MNLKSIHIAIIIFTLSICLFGIFQFVSPISTGDVYVDLVPTDSEAVASDNITEYTELSDIEKLYVDKALAEERNIQSNSVLDEYVYLKYNNTYYYVSSYEEPFSIFTVFIPVILTGLSVIGFLWANKSLQKNETSQFGFYFFVVLGILILSVVIGGTYLPVFDKKVVSVSPSPVSGVEDTESTVISIHDIGESITRNKIYKSIDNDADPVSSNSVGTYELTYNPRTELQSLEQYEYIYSNGKYYKFSVIDSTQLSLVSAVQNLLLVFISLLCFIYPVAYQKNISFKLG